MTTTYATIYQRLSELMDDWIQVDTTTNITTNTSILSTTLNQYDEGRDDYFNGWWVFITEGNNEGTAREISDYATSTGTLTVRGANLSAETGAVTIWLSRYKYSLKANAINEAARQVYNDLKKRLLDQTLVTSNVLPNSHFEDWTSSSYPDWYAVSNATAAQTTTAGAYRGPRGTSSAKVTASAADGYMYITSDTYPKLLDLMGKTVTVKVWVSAQTADDAFITIYTVSQDGSTTQTLNSTTTAAAGYWTLIKLEDQALNDDLDEIQIRFRVHTNGQYVYFDNARLTYGDSLFEYLLPLDFQNGTLTHVREQTSGLSDDICDDLYLRPKWDELFGWVTRYDGTYKYLILDNYSSGKRALELEGYCQLEDSSDAATDTVSIDDEKVTLFAYKAAKCLYESLRGTVSSDSISRFDYEVARWESNYQKEKNRLGMKKGTKQLRIRNG